MKKIICLLILFISFTILNTYSFSTYISIPTWSDNDTTEVSADIADTAENFLNIESESAILIEQSTRKNTL